MKMEMETKNILCSLLVIAFMFSLFACSRSGDNEHSNAADSQTPMQTVYTEYSAVQVEPLASPKIKENVVFDCPQSAEDYFLMTKAVVKGKVTKVTEYLISKKTSTQDKSEDSYYMTVFEMTVQKNYGDTELNYFDAETIRIAYLQSTHEYCKTVDLVKKGDSCIAFIDDVREQTSDMKSMLSEIAEYYISIPDIGLCKKYEKGYNAKKLMQIASEAGDTTVKYYSQQSLEEIINQYAYALSSLL